MIKVQGQFDVSLPVAIDAAPDLQQPSLALCHLEVEGSNVTILPLNLTEATVSDGDYEAPKLTDIRVWITRRIEVNGTPEKALISPDEERTFEKVLLEATRRFVTLVKQKTNQWDLDTRHPVYAYNYEYSLSDIPLATQWPIQKGTKRMPEYAMGSITTTAFDLCKELTADIWQQVASEASRPVSVSFYYELLSEAKVFCSHMRYDTAVLYAAFSAELMLEKVCWRLLWEKRGLSDKQCVAKASRLKIPDLLKLIHELDPSLPVNFESVRELFQLRNKIAHGKAPIVAWQKAKEAIRTAKQLRQSLSRYLEPL